MSTSDPEGLVKLGTAIPCPGVTAAVKVDCCGINPIQHWCNHDMEYKETEDAAKETILVLKNWRPNEMGKKDQ